MQPAIVTILNTSIITAPGRYEYKLIDLSEAKRMVTENSYQSAVGHQSTCDILSKLLGVDIPLNRIQFIQEPGYPALVFKLKGRPEEGRVLTVEEIEDIGYEFGRLLRIE